MFTAPPAQKNRAAATQYFDEHLSHNDYYSQTETQPGYWIGKGLQQLKLTDGKPVNRAEFFALCDNLNPATGEPLTPRQHTRIFFDFTCSAPKSVSIMAVTMNDKRIVAAHQAAASFALRELETFAATRIRKDNSQADRATGNLVGAAFTHTSSRALDPQLHTHFVLFNATWDAHEKRWKALQTSRMFDAFGYATAVYRNELARRLHEIGYIVRPSINGIEIQGVSQAILERFSKRAQERDALVAALEKKLGRQATNNEVSVLIHKSRPRKLKGISHEELRQRHLGELTPSERESLRSLERAAQRPQPFSQRVTEAEANAYAVAHEFERNSVVPDYELLRSALVKGCGQLDLSELKHALQFSPKLVRVGSEYSTRQILETELFLIERMNRAKNSVRPLHPHYVCSPKLGEDQQQAVRFVLQSPDAVTGLQGMAGTGKSTALGELSAALIEADYRPVFCAPTASATEVLRRDGLEAMTLASLLSNPVHQRQLSAKSVVVLDEAAAVGIEDMKRLFVLAQEHGSRLVLCGDTGQHSSVSRGDALRLLEEHSDYSYSQLTKIRRQQLVEYRQAVEAAARQEPQDAFARLERLGAVTEATHGKIYELAAQAYLDSLRRGKSALLVAPTWKEIEALTLQVRAALQTEGRVSRNEQTVTTLDSLSWTDAQKHEAQSYEPGLRLVFHREHGLFAKHEVAEVVVVKKSALRLKRTDGSEEVLKVASGEAGFDVCQSRPIAVAPGDSLLLQANRGKQLINGERVTVREIRDGVIVLTDGRFLPADYRQFAHGYALTSHSAQGKTAEEVLLVASTKSFTAVHREQFYVGISRGRERCQIFTDDKERFRECIGRTHRRTAALELLQEALQQKGFEPKAATVREAISSSRGIRPLRPLRPLRVLRAMRLSALQWLQRLTQPLPRRQQQNTQITQIKPQIAPRRGISL